MTPYDFKDRHKGRLALVVGSGPSLHFDRLDWMNQFVTFTVNASIMKMPKADYFVANDEGVTEWNYFTRQVPHFKGTCFLNRVLEPHATAIKPERLCFYDQKRWDDPKSMVCGEKEGEGLVASSTTCGVAVNLAHIMGCDPIVLVGNDCAYIMDHQYFWMFPSEPKPQRVKGHALPTRKMLVRGKTCDDDNRAHIEYWKTFGKANPFIDVINGTTQGLIDYYPTMNHAELIQRFGDRRK